MGNVCHVCHVIYLIHDIFCCRSIKIEFEFFYYIVQLNEQLESLTIILIDKFGQEFLTFKINFNNINLVNKLKETLPRIIISWTNLKSEKESDQLSNKQIRQQLIWDNKISN